MSASALSGKVQTVLGPIEPDDLGITLPHEHLLIDLLCYFQLPEEASRRADVDAPVTMDLLPRMGQCWFYNRENLTQYDIVTAIEELNLFKYAGGGSVVDTTSVGLARDPLALAQISRATGLNIVMGGGYYIPLSHPPDMDEKSDDDIAAEIIQDVTVGIGETGVRTGVIGELGCFYPLSENERKVLRGAGKAQAETGAPITIHPGFEDPSPQEIIDELVGAGADPRHIVMGHLDGIVRDREGLKLLAENGTFLQYDLFGYEDTSFQYMGVTDMTVSDVQRLERIETLVDMGYLESVLISHDVCQKWQYARYGGKGYAHIPENIVPRMRARGFTQEQIDTILIDNPRRAFAFK